MTLLELELEKYAQQLIMAKTHLFCKISGMFWETITGNYASFEVFQKDNKH